MAQLTPEQYETLKQRGLSDQKIAALAKSRGMSLPGAPTGLRGFATGFVKGAIRDVTRPTAQALQGLGQRAIAAATPYSLAEVREKVGVPSLDSNKPEGAAVDKILESETTAEKVGGVAANVASFFIPTSKAAEVAGKGVKAAGYAATKAGIGISAKEAPLIQAYRARTPLLQRIAAVVSDDATKLGPITNRETALRHGIFGTESAIGVQAKRGASKLWGEVIEPALTQADGKINFAQFTDEIAEQVDNVTDLSRRRELQRALEAFKEDFADVGEISLVQLQKYKEGWARFIPDKAYKGQPIAGAFRELQNIAAHLARNKIYGAVGDEVKAAYFDYGNLKNLEALGQTALTKSKLKGGAGSAVSGLLDMALIPVATTGGLALYKIGKGLEFVGAKGLKTVSQIFGL